MSTTDRSAPALARSLSFWQVTVSGVGIIIGAGIYVLIGEATREAGSAVWGAFVLAAVLSALTGLSYAELAGMFPSAGAEYEFARRAFNEFAGFILGWMMLVAYVIAAAAVSLGFAHHLEHFVSFDQRAAALALLAVLTLIVASGVQRSIWLTVALVALQVGGLLMVIVAGAPHVGDRSLVAGASATGVLSGAALVFFAYIGFDDIVTLSEETRDAARAMPRALLLALGITTALYVAVGVTAVSVVGAGPLADSKTPLALVIAHDWGGRASDIVAVIALASTANTTLLVLTAASRMAFAMSRSGSLPAALSSVSRFGRAPWVAATAAFAGSAAFSLLGEIGLVAAVTDFSVYVIFIGVNAALIRLRFLLPDARRTFVTPLSIGGLPLLPVLGTATVILMMAFLDPAAWAIGAGALAAGGAFWLLQARLRQAVTGPRT